MEISLKDHVEYIIANTARLVSHSIYNLERKKHPKRRFWSIIEKKLNEFGLSGLQGRVRPIKALDSPKTSILLLPGLRGTGKTVALLQLWDYLVNEKKIPRERVLYFSMDQIKQSTGRSLYDAVSTFIEKIHDQNLSDIKKELFVLIDEAHFDEGWDTALKVIYDRAPKKLFIAATGSSAIAIQTSPDLARRSWKEMVFPLNFSEYLIMKYRFYPEKYSTDLIREAILELSEEKVKTLNSMESNNRIKMLRKEIVFDKVFREFVFYGGFADGIWMKEFELYRKLNEVVDKTITKDIPTIHNFTLTSQNDIRRVINFLPYQTLGQFSRERMSNDLDIAVKKVDQILNSLESSHLIFHLKPKAHGNKAVRKPWKYYFMSPTLNAAVYSNSKPVDMWSNDLCGILVENFAAFYLFRMNYPLQNSKLFYESEENSADFIMESADGLIPIEIGAGQKKVKQVRNSMSRYRSEYGILIYDCEKTEFKEKILHLPLSTFAFL